MIRSDNHVEAHIEDRIAEMVIQASTVRALLRMRRYWRRLCKPSYKDRSGGSLAFMHTFSHYQEKKFQVGVKACNRRRKQSHVSFVGP
jgi:hypothetical protein